MKYAATMSEVHATDDDCPRFQRSLCSLVDRSLGAPRHGRTSEFAGARRHRSVRACLCGTSCAPDGNARIRRQISQKRGLRWSSFWRSRSGVKPRKVLQLMPGADASRAAAHRNGYFQTFSSPLTPCCVPTVSSRWTPRATSRIFQNFGWCKKQTSNPLTRLCPCDDCV